MHNLKYWIMSLEITTGKAIISVRINVLLIIKLSKLCLMRYPIRARKSTSDFTLRLVLTVFGVIKDNATS